MKTKILGLLAAGLVSGSLAAQADTLDFTEVGATGVVLTIPVNLSNASLVSLTQGMFIGAPGGYGESNGLGIACGLAATNNSCAGDWRIDFLSAVSGLSFESFAASLGDSVLVSAFNGAALVGSSLVTADTFLDFSSFGSITSLLFDDNNSTAAGIGFGDFLFSAAAVPEPGTLALLGLGLAGLGFARRRKA